MTTRKRTEPGAPANLVLMGLRGSGKSTVGRLLGERLGRPFVDLDDVTAAELGAPTAGIAFASRGEAAFRAAEFAALDKTLRTRGRVIALGGGTPTAPGAEALLRAERDAGRAVIVYLRASAAELRARLERTDHAARPSLTGKGLLDEIGDVLARRDPLYRSLASGVVEVGTMDASGAVDAVAAVVERR
jgi:shikimate kinase